MSAIERATKRIEAQKLTRNSLLAGGPITISGEEYARRMAQREPKPAPAPPPPPTYEIVVVERGMDGEIKRLIFRPIEPAFALPAESKEKAA